MRMVPPSAATMTAATIDRVISSRRLVPILNRTSPAEPSGWPPARGYSEAVSEVVLAPEQQAVFDAIETTLENLFVTGRAGTGKSTLLNYLSENTSKQIVICAPTGVAALNVGGQTIHSLFRLPIGVIADHDIEQTAELRKLLNTIETVVIDEVSMVNADLLDAMDRSLRQARQKPN